ncbi:hypothetical protein [Streptomyces mexicanus]|uniref:hypothetical protein n=1 Tax=Streptomyces mexicanus TaxID=178566 RepID=UPI003649B7F8
MSMYGIDPEETAETLDSSAHWDAANLMRQMATQITALETAVARVRKVTDEIDTEMRTEPDTQRAAMQMEAITRIRAALDGHELHRLADEAQQAKEA